MISSESTKVDARIVARTAQDKKITINVDRIGDNVRSVNVRAGFMGDKNLSFTLIDKIRQNLAEPHTSK